MRSGIKLSLIVLLVVSVAVLISMDDSATGQASLSKLLKKHRPKITLPPPPQPAPPVPAVPVSQASQLVQISSIPKAIVANPLPSDGSMPVVALPDGVGAP